MTQFFFVSPPVQRGFCLVSTTLHSPPLQHGYAPCNCIDLSLRSYMSYVISMQSSGRIGTSDPETTSQALALHGTATRGQHGDRASCVML